MPDNVGRPHIYETKEELQKRIDEYFRECEGIPFFAMKKTASAVLLGVGSAEGVKRYFEGISQKYCG